MKISTIKFDSERIVLVLIFLIIVVYSIAILTKYKIFYLYTSSLWLLICLKIFALQNEDKYSFLKENSLVIGLYLSFYLSCFWSLDPEVTLISSFWQTIFLVIYLIFYYASREYQFEVLNYLYVVLPYFFVLLNLMTILRYGQLRGFRAYSNHMAAIIVITIPFLLYSIKFDKRKFIACGALFLTIINLILSESRGALIILFISFFMAPFFWGGNYKDRLKYLFCSLSVFIFLGILLANISPTKIYLERLERRFGQSFKQFQIKKIVGKKRVSYKENITDRMRQYHVGFQIIRKYPLKGIGFGSFKGYMKKYYGKKKSLVPHNVLFTVWTGSGLLGLGLFLGIIYKAFRNLWVGYSYHKNLNKKFSYWLMANFFALVALLAHGQLRPLLTNPIFYFPLATALALGNQNYKRDPKKRYHTHA